MSLYDRVHRVTVDVPTQLKTANGLRVRATTVEKTVYVLDEADALVVAGRPTSEQRCLVHVRCNLCRRLIGEMTDYMYVDDEESYRTVAFFLGSFRVPDEHNVATVFAHGVFANGIAHPDRGVIRGTNEIVRFLEEEVQAGRRERRKSVAEDRRTELYVMPLERRTGESISRAVARGGRLTVECVIHGERHIEVDILYREIRVLRALPDWEFRTVDTKTMGR